MIVIIVDNHPNHLIIKIIACPVFFIGGSDIFPTFTPRKARSFVRRLITAMAIGTTRITAAAWYTAPSAMPCMAEHF
jgi:hypothetical protein